MNDTNEAGSEQAESFTLPEILRKHLREDVRTALYEEVEEELTRLCGARQRPKIC